MALVRLLRMKAGFAILKKKELRPEEPRARAASRRAKLRH